jgi:hypothetical protein
MVPELLLRWSGNRDDLNMARIHRRDKPFDGATLPRCVPPLEDETHRRAKLTAPQLSTQLEPELQHASLRRFEPPIGL